MLKHFDGPQRLCGLCSIHSRLQGCTYGFLRQVRQNIDVVALIQGNDERKFHRWGFTSSTRFEEFMEMHHLRRRRWRRRATSALCLSLSPVSFRIGWIIPSLRWDRDGFTSEALLCGVVTLPLVATHCLQAESPQAVCAIQVFFFFNIRPFSTTQVRFYYLFGIPPRQPLQPQLVVFAVPPRQPLQPQLAVFTGPPRQPQPRLPHNLVG